MQGKAVFDDYINEATRFLKKKDLTVRWGRDFGVFNRIITRHNERYAPSLGFSPDSDGLDGIWLVAYRGAGELVHTQACRKVSILPNMLTHFRTEASAYDTESFKFVPGNLEVNLSPDAIDINGDAIYHGEAWIKGGSNGIRGGSALCIFSRMMISKALLVWDVNTVFGLIPPIIGLKGLAQKYGYTRCEQGAIRFLDKATAPNDLWMVWMTAAEAQSQMWLKPEYFDQMLEPPENQTIEKVA